MVVGDELFSAHGRGRSRAISRSNNRNIIAIRKNCSENGMWAEPRGSNPHSYGESFSESCIILGSHRFNEISSIDTISIVAVTAVIYFSLWLNKI